MANKNAADYIRRESGILLHPTSLPGPHGIGDLGADARSFVDFLAASGQRLWQVLPLGPTGYGNSPYAARSAIAGNPLLISLDLLGKEGLLSPRELAEAPSFPSDRVDYEAVAAFKLPLLRLAHSRIVDGTVPEQQSPFRDFCLQNASWLEDFALFMALEEAHHGAPWQEWESGAATRRPGALEALRRDLADAIDFHRFAQFQFYRQWRVLKRYANDRAVRIIGDIPIFVALQSADVWSRPELFHLDDAGFPTLVAGVPPDYFSRTGQRWGNPLYRWNILEREHYGWWVDRFRAALTQVDLIRIDHFRGFQAFWEVPASHKTAERGRWVEGPGETLFRAVEQQLGALPVIAEDLGLITPEVEALRLKLGYPGMKVLHFAFDSDARNPYLPHNYERRCVVYTGTHDNDTTLGWFQSRSARERAAILRYLGTDGSDMPWDLIRLAFASVADVAIVPLQDVLGLGTWARMNLPGQADGNWTWRLAPGQLKPEHADRLKELASTYGRGM